MSPMYSVCPVVACGRLTTGGRCLEHKRADNRRRAAKGKAHGRTRASWRRKVTEAKALAGHRCQACGRGENGDDPGSKLTGHIPPELNGDHDAATVEGIMIVCRRCHGRIDQPRSSRSSNGGGSLSRDPHALAPRQTAARFGHHRT